MNPSRDPYSFAEFSFNIETGEVTGPSGTVRLQPQPAQVLRILVSRAGELVTRDELKGAVWPETNVEADQGLNYCVRQIRLALGEDGDERRFIETLPRRGYRFRLPVEGKVSTLAAPARSTQASVTSVPAVTSDDDGEDEEPATNATKVTFLNNPRYRVLRVVATIVAVIVLAVGLYLRWDAAKKRLAARHFAVAILPLATPDSSEWATNTNRDVTEQLVLQLTNSDASKFAVVGPATTARLAGDVRPQTVIGAELGVQFVVSGGVRLTDSTLFVQAIRVRDGMHVFAWREKIAGRDLSILSQVAAARLSETLGTTKGPP